MEFIAFQCSHMFLDNKAQLQRIERGRRGEGRKWWWGNLKSIKLIIYNIIEIKDFVMRNTICRHSFEYKLEKNNCLAILI